MGRPQIGWRTLGIRDRILVPRPAASMTAVSDWLKPLCKSNSSLSALSPTLSRFAGEGELERGGGDNPNVGEVPALNVEGAVPSPLPGLPLKSTCVFPRLFIPLSFGPKRSLPLPE